MLARLLRWLGRGAPAPRAAARIDATEIPAGSVLLVGGVDYRFEVLGQAGHQASLETIYRDHPRDGDDCRVIAALVSEPDRNNDPYSIGVTICGLRVAHFSREDGKKYRRVLADVASRGRVVCRASIRATPGAEQGDGGSFRVSLDLASPARAAPPEQG